MISKRGQASIEYIMILGAVLFVTIPLFFYAIYETNYKVRLNQADDAVNTIVNAADTVYSMGPGSKKYVWVSIPSGVTSSSVNENGDVQLTLSIFGGSSDILASSKAKLVGLLPQSQGTYRIAVEALEAGIVRIGSDYTDTTIPTILVKYPNLKPDELVCPGLVTLGVETDEPTICKYFKDMDYQSGKSWAEWETNAKDFEGRALTHYIIEYHSNGIYSYYVRCVDYAGKEMTDSGVPPSSVPTTNTLNLTFGVGTPCVGGQGVGGVYGPGGVCFGVSEPDYDIPVVELQSPVHWENNTFPAVEFLYNVTDTTSGIYYCVLNISTTTDIRPTPPWYVPKDQDVIVYDNDVQELINNSINVSFADKGIYIWNVWCVDDRCQAAPNKGVSEDRIINVSKNFFEAFLTSCAGQCGLKWNFRGGTCYENRPQCPYTTCGLTFDTKYPCWAGDEISDSYCTVQGHGDECCCEP